MHLRRTQASHGWTGSNLRRAPGRAAVHFRIAGRNRAAALARQERTRQQRLALERPRMATEGTRDKRVHRQTGNPRRSAPGTGHAMAAQAGLVHARARACGSAMRTKIFSARWPAPGRSVRPKLSFLGNPAFQRLFLAPRQLKPRLIVKGSGIDWLSVSAEWEQEGMKLTAADLQRLPAATGRFVKLPDAGWVELDTAAVQSRARSHGGSRRGWPGPGARRRSAWNRPRIWTRKVSKRFADSPQAKALRERLEEFQRRSGHRASRQRAGRTAAVSEGWLRFPLPPHADPTRRHSGRRHGPGQNAANARLAGVAARNAIRKNPKPSLVICPASVLHNWRREAERFTPASESAGAGKRRGAAQPAQTDSAARYHRHQLRAAAARPGRAAEVRSSAR